MEEAIKLIRRQMVICSRIDELFEELKAVLRKSRGGRDLSEAVKRIESVFAELSGLEEGQREFLRMRQQENMVGFIQAQPASVERDVAMRLLSQVASLQEKLAWQSEMAKELLQHSKEFIGYHINVLSQARADGPYGPSGAAPVEAQRGRKMFDANV